MEAATAHDFEGLGHTYIRPTGPSPCDILLVGESGGHEEDRAGYAFVGKTGRELDKFYLPLAYLKRSEVRVTNIVPYHPIGNRNPTKDEIKQFSPLIEQEIESCKPKVIVSMGYFATQWFLGPHHDMGKVHGIPHHSRKAPDAIILPSYHPAAGLHNSDNQALIVYDFQQIQPVLAGTLTDRPRNQFPDPLYIELTTASEVRASLCAAEFMGVDTEGYAGTPWGLSYCTEPGIAYVIRSESRGAVKALADWVSLHPGTRVILHNALHDLPILREMGVHVVNYEDTMVMSYCLGGLEPQGLKDLSYRHSGVRMQSYEEVTGPSMRKLTTEYLIKVAAGDWGLDPPVPRLESAEEIKYRQPAALHKRALRAVNDILGRHSGTAIGPKRGGSARLKELGVRVGKVDRDAAEGLDKSLNAWFVDVPIPLMPKFEELLGEYYWELDPPVPPEDPPDSRKRWTAMQEDLEESVERCEAAIGTLPRTGLDAIEDPRVAVDYSAQDADTTLRNRGPLFERVKANKMEDLLELDRRVLPFLDEMQTAGIRVNRQHMLDYGAVLKTEMRECQERVKEKIGIWINPASPPQTAMVIYDMLGFPVEARTETGQPSTADKILESLAPIDTTNVISEFTLYRELQKLRSTYALKLPLWTDKFSRCHPTWKYTRVASGRLSTADPNVLAIPVRTERGNKIRAGFRPEDGNVFVGVDECLPLNTPIQTINGVKPLADIRPGDAVLSLNATGDGRPRLNKVTRTVVLPTPRPVYKVTLLNGDTTICTADHKWLRTKPANRQWGREWVLTSDLQAGDRMAHVGTQMHGPGHRQLPVWYGLGRTKYIYKHAAVMQYLYGTTPEGHDIDHIDADTSNWSPDNLRFLSIKENRGQAAGNWWRAASTEQRRNKTRQLVHGIKTRRRSYEGKGNPRYGYRKGKTLSCLYCRTEFYKPPSCKAKYCSQQCYMANKRGNHIIVSVEYAGTALVGQITVERDHNYVLANGLVSKNSQIEVRIAAHLSQDPSLMDVFLGGRDFHTATAAYMWQTTEQAIIDDNKLNGGASMRASGKNVSFGILYGVSATGLQWQLKSKTGIDWSEEKCQEMIDLWLETAYPQVKFYMERMKHFCRRNGYVESMLGRRRYLPGVHSSIRRVREEAYRAAINHPIQASASEVLKVVERRLVEDVIPMFRKSGAFIVPVLQVHDEVIFEVEQAAAEDLNACIVHLMETAVELSVPLKADGHITRSGQDGGTWAELK